MTPLLALGILAAATPARAVPLYTEDAAAVAAFFASSVPLTAAKVAVHDIEGPAELAEPAAHALRVELFRLGVPVVWPDAAADYDLRGIIVAGPAVWRSSLWRKSDGGLAAVYDRALGPASPPAKPAVEAAASVPEPGRQARPRPWRFLLGVNLRDSRASWLAGAVWACPTGRWEAGLDFGNFSDNSQTHKPGNFVGQLALARHSYDVWHFRLKAGGLTRVSGYPFLAGWLPRKGLLRAGAGAALVRVTDKVSRDAINLVAGLDYPATKTTYLRPVLEAGFRLPVSARLGFDAGLEWMPAIRGAENSDFGGFASSVRVMF